MKLTSKKRPKPFMAMIKTTEGREIAVHFAENDEQWNNGRMRIEIEGKSAEIMPDVLISAYMTVYQDTSILDIAKSPFRSIILRIKSWYYGKKKRTL